MTGKTNHKKIPICFFHGLDSTPWGTKGSLIRKIYPESIIPELSPGLSERLKEAQAVIKEPVLLIGTSMGGLTAVHYAMENPGMVKGLVLMAPAVGASMPGLFTKEEENMLSSLYIPEAIDTVIIAAFRDEAVPLDSIHELIARSPTKDRIRLFEVDDDHDLHNHLDLILKEIEDMLDRVSKI